MEFQLCKECKREEWVESDDWLYNIKFDGERAFVFVKDFKIDKILTRRGNSCLARYPEFQGIRFNVDSALLDCEICAFDERGQSDFNLLALRSHLKDEEKIEARAKEISVKIMAFDILNNGENLTMKPLNFRIEELKKAVKNGEYIEVAEYYDKLGKLWIDVLKNDGEGVIAKHRFCAYEGKRAKTWIKIKNWNEAVLEFDGYENAVSEKFGFIKGITLTNKDGVRCACLGEQHKPLKEALDRGQVLRVCIQYLNRTNGDKFRFISFKEWLK